MADVTIAEDDPLEPDVRRLIDEHLANAQRHSPPENVHAMGAEQLTGDGVTFYSLRAGGEVLAVGALQHLEEGHGEIKSMFTTAAARGAGHGRTMLEFLLTAARGRDYRRVSLETGTMEYFAAARALYRSAGFEECEPYGSHWANPHSVCMTRELDSSGSSPPS